MRIVIECGVTDLLEGGLTDFGCIKNEIIKDIEVAISAYMSRKEGNILTYEVPQIDLKIEVSNKKVGSCVGDRVTKSETLKDINPNE